MAKTLRKLGVERSFLSLTSTIQSVPDDILNGESFPPVPRMGAGEGSPLLLLLTIGLQVLSRAVKEIKGTCQKGRNKTVSSSR